MPTPGFEPRTHGSSKQRDNHRATGGLQLKDNKYERKVARKMGANLPEKSFANLVLNKVDMQIMNVSKKF